jgi:hypothetical protein
MHETYKKIWLRNDDLYPADLENIDGHNLCYVALFHASKYQTAEAQRVLKQISETQSEHLCSIVLEANSLVYFKLREFNAAKEFALNALQKTANSLFSCSILARIALFEKRYMDGVRYYQKILKYVPESDRAILNIAESFALNKNIKTASEYVKMAKSSGRRSLYKFFFLFMHLWIRLLWMLLLLVLLINPYVYISFYTLSSILLVYLFLYWGQKQGDLIILRSVVYFQSIHTIIFIPLICSLLNTRS